MKIGLYFGSFNPIHTGHCIIAHQMAYQTDLQQVWLVISPQNPFKPSNSLLNEYHRLHLAKLAVQGIDRLKVTDIEFHLPRPSYTIDTLVYLEEKFPQHAFSLVMGSDGLQNLHNWKNAPTLLERYALYVYPRPGFPVASSLPARITEVKAPLLDISATYIREQIRTGKDIHYLVPDPVRIEIEKNGYYK